jgi:hypothetical protein
MHKASMKSKIFLLLLVGVVTTLNACQNTSENPSNPASESTPQELGKRPDPTPKATADSSDQETASSTSKATPLEVEKRLEPTPPPPSDPFKQEKTSSTSPSSRGSQTGRQDNTDAKATAANTQTPRSNYKQISLSQRAKPETLVGDDPKAIALAALGDIQSEGGSREVTVDYPQPNQAIVTITQTGVADDSIGGIRYRAELVPTSKAAPTGNQWKLVWAGSQVKCQPGRGHQDWTTELCL